jgi:DNA polymerase
MTTNTARPSEQELASIDDLGALRTSAARCTRCPLHEDASRTVFGDGPAEASLVLIGEQPGDREDLAGQPFVGPAGGVLARALEEAGVRRDELYLTNAVKHFKFEQRGKRRVHQRPTAGEVRACRPWLDAELRLIRPRNLVLLGATAAKALLGAKFRLTAHRGEVLRWAGQYNVVATIHPSAVLRAPQDVRDEMYRGLVDDLRLAARSR